MTDNDLSQSAMMRDLSPLTKDTFEEYLLTKAKSDVKTIVLPEGSDDRILIAADFLLSRNIIRAVILGNHNEIIKRAEQLNLKAVISQATIQSLSDSHLLEQMIPELTKIRSHKGFTEQNSRDILKDANYFGTMLIQLGFADAMVSGAIHTTADTVRPALQIIRTTPNNHLVSSSYLMCLDDRAVVFADCAINLNPSSEQLAEIAYQSSQTAQSFGLDPVIGLLTYSTLNSGKGPDIERVTKAQNIITQKYPDLKSVGPIQFDAAWSPEVAVLKAPENPYAGKVNTFIFPCLSAGNICYKAVQRVTNSIAIGPILQGLRKPINDLSRGVTTRDIINTIALTAIRAQDNDDE